MPSCTRTSRAASGRRPSTGSRISTTTPSTVTGSPVPPERATTAVSTASSNQPDDVVDRSGRQDQPADPAPEQAELFERDRRDGQCAHAERDADEQDEARLVVRAAADDVR